MDWCRRKKLRYTKSELALSELVSFGVTWGGGGRRSRHGAFVCGKESLWFCVILSYTSVFILTRYSGRHVGRKMDQQLFGLLLFILLSLREAALLIQAKAVIGCEALQKSTHSITFFLKEKPDMTSVVRKQDVVVLCHIHKLIISTQDLQTTKRVVSVWCNWCG